MTMRSSSLSGEVQARMALRSGDRMQAWQETLGHLLQGCGCSQRLEEQEGAACQDGD
jgi:hypothetical protein